MTEQQQIAEYLATHSVTKCPPRTAPGLTSWESALGTIEPAPVAESMAASRDKANSHSIAQQQSQYMRHQPRVL